MDDVTPRIRHDRHHSLAGLLIDLERLAGGLDLVGQTDVVGSFPSDRNRRRHGTETCGSKAGTVDHQVAARDARRGVGRHRDACPSMSPTSSSC
jgi:hypothetical protein